MIVTGTSIRLEAEESIFVGLNVAAEGSEKEGVAMRYRWIRMQVILREARLTRDCAIGPGN